MPDKKRKAKNEPQSLLSNLSERVTQVLEMPLWLKQPLSALVFVVVAVFLVFQLVTANPYGNRVAESLVKSLEESNKTNGKAADSLSRSADSLEKIVLRIEKVEVGQDKLETRVAAIETHIQEVDQQFHKSLKK
jgi:hypothetical protein